MVKARKIVLARVFQGEPRPEDFRIEQEDLPPLRDGQILAEAVYISVDPYQRVVKSQHSVGNTMIGSQVARIVESRAAGFPVGRYVVGYWGWRDRTVADVGPDAPYFISPPTLVPDLGELPLSLAVGVLGMPGITAYFGFLELCKPKPGEVAVITGAAGAVGSIVGQIARLKGCTVIGFAGSDAKVKWLKEELGFHHAFNYKTTDIDEALKKAAPEGVDVYFDNVGGEQRSTIINNVRDGGRISLCGSISGYNSPDLPKATTIQPAVVSKQLRMEDVASSRWRDRWEEGINQLKQWIREGKIKYRETVTDGFQNTPKAFIGMLRGENFGKAVVKL